MENIRPRSLSTQELVHYYALWLEKDERGAPLNWQVELLRRLLLNIGNSEAANTLPLL